MTSVRSRVIVGLALLGAGCFGSETTEFPEGLEPLGENDLEGPGTPDDPYPEEFQVEGENGARFSTVLGRGYIHAPPADVWAAYRDPAVGADRRTSPGWTSEPVADHPYDDSYVIHHIATEIITVEWDVTWRHGLVEGTPEEPGARLDSMAEDRRLDGHRGPRGLDPAAPGRRRRHHRGRARLPRERDRRGHRPLHAVHAGHLRGRGRGHPRRAAAHLLTLGGRAVAGASPGDRACAQ
ncbi:MAG: hypothetical protein M5U28_37225 [Sandaracinaceae bacterium]|nr:hypothetical protein [Sandaracinaceae bacterium]